VVEVWRNRVVTNAVRSPVRPATRWRLVVSSASTSVMARRIVVSRRARIDVPAPGGPSKKTLWSERLHDLQLHQSFSGCRRVPRLAHFLSFIHVARPYQDNSSSSALASCRSAVSKPSVNQP
jgi:hypothetical protein